MPSNKSEQGMEIQRKIEQKWNEIDEKLRQQAQEMATENKLIEASPVSRNRKKLPSKSRERVKELQIKFDQKQIEAAEELRHRSQELAKEYSLVISPPVPRRCTRQLEPNPWSYCKIASIILIAIGTYGLLNNFSNSFIDNPDCAFIFPFNLLCNRFTDVTKIVY